MTINEWDTKNENKIIIIIIIIIIIRRRRRRRRDGTVKTRTDFFQRALSSVIAQLTFEEEKYDLSLLNAMDETTA